MTAEPNASRQRKPLPRTGIVLLLLLVFAKGLLWAILIPPWQNPDEPIHFAYVQYLAEAHRLPITARQIQGVCYSPQQSNAMSWGLYGHVTGQPKNPLILTRSYARAYQQAVHRPLSPVSCGSSTASGYPPAYYLLALLPYLATSGSILAKLLAVRALSALLGTMLALVAFLAGRYLVDRPFGIALALLTGFQPQASMIFASVNNDVLLDLLTAILFLLLLRVWKEGPSLRRAVGYGLVGGLSLLAKAEGFAMAGILTGVAAWSWGVRQRKWLPVLVLPAVTGLLYLPWAGYSLLLYGNVFGSMGHQPTGTVDLGILAFLKAEAGRWYHLWVVEYYATFGWLDTRLPTLWYRLLLGAEILALLGILAAFLLPMGQRRGDRKQERREGREFRRKVFLLVLVVAGNLLALYAFEWIYMHRHHRFVLQGRYLLPTLVPINALGLMALDALTLRRLTRLMYAAAVLFMLLLNLASLAAILHRYYGVVVL